MALTRFTSKVMPQYRDLHLKVDFKRKFVALDSRTLAFTRKEYELFSLLVENAGEVIPRQELLMRVWGYRNDIRTHTLEVHIYRLRKVLGLYSDYIENVFRQGYRFQPVASRSALLARNALVRGA
jgi:DNA-binding response OmpR family regulator